MLEFFVLVVSLVLVLWLIERVIKAAHSNDGEKRNRR
jgi:hypothetical protein